MTIEVHKLSHNDDLDITSIRKKFVEECTLHGLKPTFKARSKTQRCIWFALLLSAFCYVIYLTAFSFTKYLRYPVTTKTTVMFEENTHFPAVTICNFNRFDQEKASKHGYHSLMKYYAIPDEKTKENVNISSKQMETIHQDIGMELGLFKCTWKGVNCSIANFSTIVTSMGKCYTYNSGAIGYPLINSSSAGSEYGLELVLDINQKNYMVNHETAGLKMMLHDQNVPANIQNMGVALSPGSRIFASVLKTKITGLPEPYANACKDKEVPGYKTYSKAACMSNCYTNHVIEACGCKTVEMKGVARVCSFYETETCVQKAKLLFEDGFSSDCNCTRPCKEIIYTPNLSYASFPSMVKFNSNTKNEPWIEKYSALANGSWDRTIDLVRSNIILINIFYEGLYYELTETEPAFTMGQLFGEIGGQCGLFAGASLLTFYEFIDIIVDLISLKRRKNKSHGRWAHPVVRQSSLEK